MSKNNLKISYRDGGRLDGNATFLFVLSGVRKSSLTGLGASDDTSFTIENGKISSFATLFTEQFIRTTLIKKLKFITWRGSQSG